MLSLSVALANAMLGDDGFQDLFNLGFLYLYAGTPPANAGAALDMVATHTQLLKVSNNSTATGLTFANPASGSVAKNGSETWSGVVTPDGFDTSDTTQTPTFYRLCAAGDNGRGAADGSTGYRVQGTVGAVGSGADLQVSVATLTSGDTRGIGAFSVSLVGA